MFLFLIPESKEAENMAECILGIICRKFLILMKDILTDSRYNTKKYIQHGQSLKRNGQTQWKGQKAEA